MAVHIATETMPRIDQWLSLVLFSAVLLFQGLVPAVPPEYLDLTIVPQLSMAAMPIHAQKEVVIGPPEITAQAYVIVDVASASLLAEKNADQALYPASTTKLVTALVAAQSYDPTKTWQLQPEEMTEYSTTGFRIGDEVQVGSLMAALLIESDNAAAEIFAHRYPGGRQAFIAAMEQYAQSKQLSHTKFANPAGFDDSIQQLSAADLVVLAREILQVPWLLDLTSLSHTKIALKRGGQPLQLPLVNTNKLLDSSLGIKGMKTGTTPAAGEVLVSLVENKEHPLLVVVMGSQDRFTDTRQLIQWAQSTYSWQSIP